MNKLFKISLLAVIALVGKACSDDNPAGPKVDPATVLEQKKSEFVSNYVNIVEASYGDALSKTKAMQTAIDAFVASPSESTLTTAKQSWLEAREPYGQTEAYRFYDGPIDGADGEPEGYINAWPLDEALIDYVASGSGGEDTSDDRQNIVNNTEEYPVINKESLLEISGYNDNESNVTLGYHAIEFLLWGQDDADATLLTSGVRSFTDYTTAANADRRGQYLKVAAAILVDNLQGVYDQWKSDGAYRKSFLALDSNDAINKILTGAAKLSKGELAGERMFTAVENQSQEDEHSCFSDNTHRDVYLNAESINNIINGKYKRVDGSVVSGTSLLDVLALANDAEAQTLATTSALVMTKVNVISEAKFFDNQIISETTDNNEKPVMSAVSSLRKQGDQLAQAGKTITGKVIDPSV